MHARHKLGPRSPGDQRWLPRTSIWCIIIGLFAKSTMGFGTVSVKGLSLVPKPPTNIKAFMVPGFAVLWVQAALTRQLLRAQVHTAQEGSKEEILTLACDAVHSCQAHVPSCTSLQGGY